MSELRYDPIRMQWVLIAPERGDNPQYFFVNNKPFALEQADCPFCPGNEKLTAKELYRITDPQNHDAWVTRVVPNNVPVLKVEELLKRTGHGMYDHISGMGAHEVIIDTPLHKLGLSDYTDNIFHNVFTAAIARIKDLNNDNRIRYINVFKNHGFGAGAFMEHPHTQVVGFPVITKYVKHELMAAKNYYLLKERCLYCDVINEEMYENQRIVAENLDFVAFVPYAAPAAFEVQIMPKRHNHDVTTITSNELKSFAAITAHIFHQYDLILGNPPLNFSLYTAPPSTPRPEYPSYWQSIKYDYHWHLSLVPRITRLNGLDIGGGLLVNPVLPEKSALLLRQVST